MGFIDTYSSVFKSRGSKYDKAMRLVPEARRQEFLAVIDELAILPGGTVLDVPAGGGYLADYLPARFRYVAHEPVAAFHPGAPRDSTTSLLPLPYEEASFEAIVSVAGVHHTQDKRALFAEMARVAKPDALLVVADAHEESPVAAFLDGYIDESNSTGHCGSYLGRHTLKELANCGWQVESAQRKHYQWRFEDRDQLLRFCHLIFDVTHEDIERTGRRVESELGIVEDRTGAGLCWDLFVIAARRTSPQ